MLTDDERREIEEELRDCPSRRAASVEALKVVQRHRRWVADEQVAEVAAMLDITADELDEVATFYPFIFRKPVGRHIIYVCDSVSCWVMGYEAVREGLTRLLGISWGGTTGDGRFTLLPVSCLGACDRAPAIMIDGELYGDLVPERLEAILGEYG